MFSAKTVAFLDDLTVPGKLAGIRKYFGKLTVLGPNYNHFPEASKSYLILKEYKLDEVRNIFNNSNMNITIECIISSNE